MEPASANVRLLLGGDVMTGRGIDQVQVHSCAPGLFEACVCDAREYVRLAEALHGPIPAPAPPDYLWGDALAEMDRVPEALRIVNLETAVTTAQDAWPGKGIHYRMHPANVECLRAARLDAVSLANNHVLDWGRGGLAETLAVLAAAGLRSAGAGLDGVQACAPAVLDAPGGRRVLLSAWALPSSGVPPGWEAAADRPGIALLPDLSAASVARVTEAVARAPGDLSIVSLHWGGNWGFALPAQHRAFAHLLVDAGAADVVHGHSSHHPLPVEVYRGRALLYGCGDLVNDYEGIGAFGSLRCDVACLYLLTLDRAGLLQELELVPLQLCRFRLERAASAARTWLRRVFEEEGRRFGTRLADAADGRWRLLWPRAGAGAH